MALTALLDGAVLAEKTGDDPRVLALHGWGRTRADWLRELKQPGKCESVAQYCDHWWIVAPPGVVGPGELPAAWGLLVARGDGLRAEKHAPKRPDVLPLAHKGMMRQLPAWLLDPLGPLSIPPAYLPRLLPWLYRFWRAGADRHFERAVTAQAALMQLAEREWMALLDRSGTRPMLREDGALELYETEAEFKGSLPGWDVRARFGD